MPRKKTPAADAPKKVHALSFLADVDKHLSSEEKAALRAKAVARVAEEAKEAAEDMYMAEAMRQERAKLDPDEEIKRVLIDVAGHANKIVYDGVEFFHGYTYDVPRGQYCSLLEIAARTWDHENEVGGANRDEYRKPRNLTLRPGHENAAASQLF